MEGHLTVEEQLAGELLADHELALAVADRNSVEVADFHTGKPRRVGGGYPCGYHLGDVTVDVVAEEGRGLLGDKAEPAVRQQSALDQSLETVADAKDESAPVNQPVDGGSY